MPAYRKSPLGSVAVLLAVNQRDAVHKHRAGASLSTDGTHITAHVVAIDADLLKSSRRTRDFRKSLTSDVSPSRVVSRILKLHVQGRSGAAASLAIKDHNGFAFSIVRPLQVKTSFRFTKIIESVSKDLENFEKHRMQLFNKYGEQQPDNSSTISAGNIELFNQEMTSLLQETVEIPEIKFSLEDLGDIQISPADLMFFTPWLTDTE